MLNLLPWIMIRCLILTIVIECGLALLLGIRKKNDLLSVLLVNVVTNPIVVVSTFLVSFYFGGQTARVYEYIIEITVLVVEGLIYFKLLDFKKMNPFLVSLLLNMVSYLSGVVINFIIY